MKTIYKKTRRYRAVYLRDDQRINITLGSTVGKLKDLILYNSSGCYDGTLTEARSEQKLKFYNIIDYIVYYVLLKE